MPWQSRVSLIFLLSNDSSSQEDSKTEMMSCLLGIQSFSLFREGLLFGTFDERAWNVHTSRSSDNRLWIDYQDIEMYSKWEVVKSSCVPDCVDKTTPSRTEVVKFVELSYLFELLSQWYSCWRRHDSVHPPFHFCRDLNDTVVSSLWFTIFPSFGETFFLWWREFHQHRVMIYQYIAHLPFVCLLKWSAISFFPLYSKNELV